MTSMNSTNTFSGDRNRGLQLGSNSGPIHVNNYSQPEISQQKRWLDISSNATQAAFNSFERQHDSMCLHDTRVDVLNEIRAWADRQDERRIYWLNGLAGTGKSTIARTIAREYFEHNRLGASFFFSKGGGDVSHARKFFTTIAFQLAEHVPSIKSYICDAVSKNNDIETRSLRDQWNQLILQPFSRLVGTPSRSSYILVIDALDECESANDIRVILRLLAEVRDLETVQLRVFLTSRPEISIRNGFYRLSGAEHQDFVLHNISPSIQDHDIRIFLESNFKLIGQERSLDTDWPGEQIIKRLTQKASGLFIWAATACRFVYDGKRFAIKRLDMILEGNIDSTSAPENYLDQIYVTVLEQSLDSSFTDEERQELYVMLRQLLGSILVLFSPLSVDSLCRLLDVTKEGFDQTLEDLHAILDIPSDQTWPLRLHHPSFRDFLINEERCRDPNFWIDERHAHQSLVNKCIQLMENSLKQDICSLDTYGAFVADIDSNRVQLCLPQEVQYACLYWILHLQKSGGRLEDDGQVHRFLQEHVLHWLEALSWMRKVSEGILAVISLELIALTSGGPNVYTFIHDIKRFVLYSRPAIEQAPLQVYCSALVFAPKMSMISKQFKDRMPRWIKRIPKIEKNWSAVLLTLEAHSSEVNAVSFSPDGKVLASASNDRTVKLWDAGTGAALQTLKTHSSGVNAVSFSPDGKVLASASNDRTVKLWDAGTGAALQTLKDQSGFFNAVNAVAFSPDSKVLASASNDGTVKLWDVGTGTALQMLKGHSNCVNAIAFSPDGKMLASASNDRTVKLWDAGTGAALQTLKDQSGFFNAVNAVAFSSDGKVLASASSNSVKLWDVGTGTVIQTLEGHSNRVKAIAFSPDGKVLASASIDETVKMWDVDPGMLLQTLRGHSHSVKAIAFSPDSKVLASASIDKTVKMWDVDPGMPLLTLGGHSDLDSAFAFLPDRASRWIDAQAKMVGFDDGAALQILQGHWTHIIPVAFSPDGKVLASASNDGTVRLWDVGTEAALQTPKGHSDYSSALIFSPDGKVLASASHDGKVKLWDVGTGAVLQIPQDHPGDISSLIFSPDGKVLALSSRHATVKLRDVGTGAVLQILRDHSGFISAIAFSPDGKVLASASHDGTVKLWDVGTGAVLQILQDHPGYISAIAFSPDSKVLASASHNGTVKLWDVGTGAVLQILQDHPGYISAIAFSPDGKVLALASSDQTVKLRDVGTGALIQTLEVDAVLQTVSFTDDGMFLKTDRGILSTTSFSPSEFLSQQNLSRAIFVKNQWITWGMENVIWLPPEYRTSWTAVHGSVIVLEHFSGRLSILELA